MKFEFRPLSLKEVLLVVPETRGDGRGSFSELYRRSEFARAGVTADFVQDNRSVSALGVVRGCHYQLPPFAQPKLVRCARGRILDLAVDVRKGSPTFGKWAGEELDAASGRMLYIPAGFAHAFEALEEGSEVFYKAGAEYDPASERGVNPLDPSLALPWRSQGPLLSPRDAALPALSALRPEDLF